MTIGEIFLTYNDAKNDVRDESKNKLLFENLFKNFKSINK